MSVSTARSRVWTQLAESSHSQACLDSPADASSRKSLFYIMSRHGRQDSGQRKFFHADVWTLGQHVQRRFTKILLSNTCPDTTA
jgi:hypothetical protein